MPPSTFAPGHLLATRYRIAEFLGVGTTAEVYTAEDLSLHRTVVVKVLLSELAGHEDVRRAFRDRIIRAATLSHPYLARVYDGGQESGAIFMITEYMSRGSLEDVLASGRTLSIDEVARLGRDVASALGYAHANGFVHGSLSPSTLLFDDEGMVRVSDVTLAGLGDAYRQRFTLNDVRYLSPEQATGEPATPESDVYALALILFESVTGTTAFDGVTPEAVLRARINAPLPVRLELGTLDMLLAQAAVPDPRLRLDAEQFSSRLGAVASDPAPLSIVAGTVVPLLVQHPPLEPRRSIGFHPPSPDEITGSVGVVGAASSHPRHERSDDHVSGNRYAATRPRAPKDDDDTAFARSRRPRWAVMITALLVVIVAGGAGAAWKFGVFTQEHTVPSLIGLTLPDASSLLKSDGYGFSLTVSQHASSSTVAVDHIVTQSPTQGTNAKSGLVISVSLSSGPSLVTLPTHLVGESCSNATTQLAAMKVNARCPANAAVLSAVVPAGRVAKVLYQGTTNPLAVPKGSTLTLVLSKGAPVSSTTVPVTTTTVPVTTTTAPVATTTLAHPLRAVPDVAGMTRSQVFAAMKAAQLYFTTVHSGTSTTKWTTAISSNPPAGTMVKWESNIIVNVK